MSELVTESYPFSVADATGRVIRTGRLPDPAWIAHQAQGDEQAVAGALNAATQWVDAGEVRDRPENPAVLTGMTLTELPVPSVIVIDGNRYDCNETQVDLDLPYSVTYTVTVEAFPYRDKHFSVTP